jgi:kumamolisin
MKISFSSALRSLFLIMTLVLNLLSLNIDAKQSNAATVTNTTYIRLPGHVPKQLTTAKSLSLHPLDSDQIIPLTLVLPLRNQQELEDLVQRMYDPADTTYYGKYLTSEEFMERFAPTQKDYEKVMDYAHKLGLSVLSTHPNRLLLDVSGSAYTVEEGFKLNLYQYRLKSGRDVYAPTENPAVPYSVASLLKGVIGLDDLAVWRTYKKQKKQAGESVVGPHASSNAYPSGPNGGFTPNDLIIAYNLAGVSANGSGQNIALFELASYQASDIIEYANYFNLPTPQLKSILVDGGSNSGIDAEVTLDIQLAIALAPESQILVYEGPNSYQGVLDTYNRIATDNLAKQVSTSWGLAEDLVSQSFLNAEHAIFLQMAVQGQTIYAAAGDSGAYDDPNKKVLVVDDPASQPYVVGVGGTTLSVNAQTCAYVTESVWNHGFGNGGGGGGVSKVWPIPDWQKNIPTAYSNAYRNVPDVSLNADPNTGYAIFYNGQWEIYGGTSCAAPLWAAFTARVNQELTALNKPALGFANPLLYAIGVSNSSSTAFHDILTGNNAFYNAQKSYDNATGWGSFNGANLFVNLTNPSEAPSQPPVVAQPSHLTVKILPSAFRRAQIGSYQIGVSNSGQGATSSEVSVKVTLPKDLTYSSFIGAGWKFNSSTLTFTRSDSLSPGKSYPSIQLYVKVSKSPSIIINTSVTVSGGGSDSSTVKSSSRAGI